MEQEESDEEEEEEEEDDSVEESEEEEPQTKKSKMTAAAGKRGKVIEKTLPPKRGKIDEVNKALFTCESRSYVASGQNCISIF